MTTTTHAEPTLAATDIPEHYARPVPVIAKGKGETKTKTWTAEIYLCREAILTINAQSTGNYSKPDITPQNAGLNTKIFLGRRLVASNQSFEGESRTVDFFSTATYSGFMRAGTYELRVVRDDLGAIDEDLNLEVEFHAVAARYYKKYPAEEAA